MVRDQAPDLILLDLMLPGIDGYEVLNQLQIDPQTANIPVVIVSAKPQLADRQMAAKIGADAYLTKPYLPDELVNLARTLISEKREKPSLRGTGVILVASQEGVTTSVSVNLGLALVAKGQTVTTVDLRPFSIAHSLFLGISPRPDLAPLSKMETASQLGGLAVQHASGLRLLNNLEGSGEAGQFTPQDAKTVFSALLAQEGYVLVDAPLYPMDVLRQATSHCAQMLVVSQNDPASLGATRSALTVIQRVGLMDADRLGVVLVGPSTSEDASVTNLGYQVLAILSPDAGPDDSALNALTERLLRLA